MDEAAAVEIAEDGAEKNRLNGDNADQNCDGSSLEDSADSKYPYAAM